MISARFEFLVSFLSLFSCFFSDFFMRRSTVKRLERAAFLLTLVILLMAGWLSWRSSAAGFAWPWDDPNRVPRQRPLRDVAGKTVGIIAGHMGFDSGAVCDDGLQETQVTQAIARLAAERLTQAGASVQMLAEKDTRLDGYQADAFISLHADSCIEVSGYKAARSEQSAQPLLEDKFLRCIYREYGAKSGLPQHLNSISHNMTQYYAFNRIAPTTPAVILELGFMGGDRTLLTTQQERLAWGVSQSVLCFLDADR